MNLSHNTVTCKRNRNVGAGRIMTRRRLTLLLLAVHPFLAAAQPVGVWPRVEPGIEYLHERIGEAPWSIHVVKVDRSRTELKLAGALAQGRIYGLASVTDQIESVTAPDRKPIAAINGDFFHIRSGPYQGDPLGVQIVKGELVSAPTGQSFWMSPEGQPHIGEVEAAFVATGPDGLNLTFGLNQKCETDAAVLYTPAVGESTRTAAGMELILERDGDGPWLPLQAGGHYQARIAAIRTESNTPLKPEIMVLSIGPELAAELPVLTAGMTMSLSLETAPDLTGVTTALGGGRILLRGGKASDLKHYPHRHPRTAIGWNSEHLCLVVVDGRQQGLSKGMNYTELSALMLRLGCTEAINLDGGGSSTLWLGGHVMNSPSDGQQRRVANSLIVVATEPAEQP
jgi:Phosphodiester glycosidase